MRMSRPSSFATPILALAMAMAASSCAAPGGTAGPGSVGTTVTVEGTLASIDTKPWAYDGNAIAMIDTSPGTRVEVQLPARWNLCQAQAVDVEALAVGMQVQAVGARAQDGIVTVCTGSDHRLVPATP